MNILVTGARGQLGQEIQRAAAELGGNAGLRFTFADSHDLDITKRDDVLNCVRELHIDTIVNCAAYTQVDRAEDDAEAACAVNALGAGNLAEAAQANKALLIHVSTDYVFGGGGNTPRSEDDATHPLGVYGRTKLEGEQLIQRSGCRHLIIRTAWLYSRHGSNFVKTMCRLLHEKEAIKVVFDQVGTPTYAGDLADAIMSIIRSVPRADQEGIYHYSNEGVCSWYDFAVAIADAIGSNCAITPCRSSDFPSKVTRPAYSVLDKSKIRRTFGLHIPHWQQSLRRLLSTLPGSVTSSAPQP